MTKRIISMVLAVVTVLSILPSNIWAGNNTGIAATVRTATATVSDHAAMQGRTVRRNTYWDSFELSADPASAGSEFVQASVIPVELYMIVDAVYTRTSDGTVWYKVSAAPGHTLPETLSSHRWIMQNFAGNPYGDPDALIAVYELCPDCGKENCKEDHTTQPTETTVPGETTQPTAPSAPVCDICGKENCTAQHVKCGFCGKYDCTEEHFVTVNGTFTDAAGKTQTLTVSAETFPEGTKVTAKQADVNAQLQSFGIPAKNKVFGLDISLQTAETSNYQPGEPVLVKIPVSAPAGTKIGILHTHDGKTTFMGVTRVQSDGTVGFDTSSFSEFVAFTVDFHYNGVDYSINGETSILLSQLFTAMGINEDASKASSVVFSDPSLVKVTKEGNDWLLTSLVAFDTQETLVITFSDGHVIVIDVTDARREFSFGSTGVTGHTKDNGAGARDVTVILYQGNTSTELARDTVEDVNRNFYLTLNGGSNYWLEVREYSGGSKYEDGPYQSEDQHHVCFQSIFANYNDITIKVNCWSLTVSNSSNSKYCYVKRLPKIVAYSDHKETRNVHIIVKREAGDETVEKFTGLSFPDRNGDKNGHDTINADLDLGTPSTAAGYKYVSKTASGTTYYVYIRPIKYTVSFNGNGATSGSMSSQSFEYDVSENLNANSFSRAYTVSFNSNGGGAVSPLTATATFNGWATSSTGSVKYSNKQAMLKATTTDNKDIPLYANWTLGSVKLPTPTAPLGYTFAGWSDGTNTYKAGANYTPTANTTLTAVWSVLTYKVSFNGNGATGGSMAEQSFTYDVAQKLNTNAFVRVHTVTLNDGTNTTTLTATATFNGWEDRGSIEYKGQTYAYTTFDAPFYANKYSDLMSAFGYNKYNLLNHWVTYTVNGSETRVAVGSNPGLYPNGATVSNLATTQGYVVPLYANWTLGTVTLPTPTGPAGYHCSGWYSSSTYSDSSYVGQPGESYSPSTNVTLYAKWSPNTNTPYTVKHYQQNVADNNYTEVTADRQTLTGTTGQSTNAVAKTYTGFTAQSFSQVTIAGDGSAVVSIYYNRNSYTVTVNKGTGISSVTGGGSYKYGASVTINATLNAGYKWKNWTGHSTQTAQSYTFTMPAANVTYTANAEAAEVSYTVKHYQQNLADDNYTEVAADRQTLTGTIGQNTNAAAKTYTGFTAQAFSQTTIAADGTTVVSIYYNRNSYTVTATAGTGIASVSGGGSYKYGASVTLKANLKTGYAWANWTGTATVATRDYTFTMPANNVSYQANATKENYSISYTLNGGSVATANVASYNVDTPGFTLTNPTKTAYDFVGWTGTGLTGATMTVTVPQGSIGNRSYTANWNPKNYTATFDANGGNVSTGSKSFNVEGALTLPDATKPGYSLVWEVTSGSGNWTVGDTYTGSVPAGKYGDVTFTAQWSPINYSISYNLNGGSVATPNKTSYNVETATFTLTNPTKAGYTFAGWTGTDLTGATVTVTVPQGSIGNRSYTATWTANTYTLTLDYNGGWEFSNANQTSVTKQVTYGTGNNASVSSLQPTRTGYRFVGWFTDPQGGSAVYDSQGNAVPGAYWDANGNWIGTDDMPLYAHWAEQYRYELTFDSNTDDAVTDMPAGMADTGWVDTADKTHTWAVVPVRVGYEFLGWSDDPNATTGAKVTSYTLTGVGAETVSQTLYAVWKAIDYNVTFVDHDGTVLKATVQYPFGTPAESIVRPADPVRAATAQYTYTFSGWDPTVSKVTGDVIYTATYKATLNRYTVTFEDGEGNVLKQETYDYGTKPEYIVTPADPEKEGDQQYTYIFTGWSPAIGQVTGDAVYTPVYLSVTNRYKVTFVDEDTTTVLKAETEYDYGTPAASIVQPATPTKTGDVQYGYTFVGWTPVLGDVVDHVTYIATYDRFVNKYKVTFLNHDSTVLSQKEYEYGTEGSAIELPTDPVKPEDDRFIYTFAGWSPSVQEVTGDVVYTPTYTTELRFPMVDLTITTTCANKDQSFVFTVVGKADDIAYGEVRLEVILVGDDSVTIRDLPVGDYTVTEKDGWSWRHTEKAQQSVRLDEAEELTFAFGGNDKLFWLSGWHANKRRKGGN